MKGRYFANLFIHFEVSGNLLLLENFPRDLFTSHRVHLFIYLSLLVTHSVTTAIKPMLEAMSTKNTVKL
jgi:hypothetical protein